MARMVSRSRPREGRGIGEILSEYIVFILMGVGIIAGAYWYFMVYQKSAGVALSHFLSAVNAGNVDSQYALISASSKADYKNKYTYDDKCPFAHGFSARLQNFSIDKLTESGDKADVDVTTTVRKTGQELVQTGSDNFKDHYILRKEADGWKVDLHSSWDTINTKGAASRFQAF